MRTHTVAKRTSARQSKTPRSKFLNENKDQVLPLARIVRVRYLHTSGRMKSFVRTLSACSIVCAERKPRLSHTSPSRVLRARILFMLNPIVSAGNERVQTRSVHEEFDVREKPCTRYVQRFVRGSRNRGSATREKPFRRKRKETTRGND